MDRPRRLAFTWNWDDDGEAGAVVEDTVVVTFEPGDDGTLVTAAHASAAHAPDGAAEQGWNDVLDRMVQVVGQPRSSRS